MAAYAPPSVPPALQVVLLASSILSTENVIKSLPVQRLKRNTLFVDVLSVKVRGQRAGSAVLQQQLHSCGRRAAASHYTEQQLRSVCAP